MSRLPIPGQDDNVWGNILNDYLGVSLAPGGTLNSNVVGTAQLQDNCVTNAKLDSSTQSIIASVASKYVKPAGGIPSSDLSSAVQTSLSSANNALPASGGTMTGKLIVPSFQVTGGSPSSGEILTADSSGNATWAVPPSAPVSSVAGKTGAVTLVEGDVASLTTDLAAKAADSAVVHNTGNETVAGVKTFTSAPVVPSNSFPESAVTNLTTDLSAKYVKPGGGIPSTDMTSAVQTALGDATSAVQSVNGHIGTSVTVSASDLGALLASNNLSDVASAGTSRQNIHVPALLPAACVAAANVASLSGLNTYDGYTLTAGDQVLLIAQSTASQNGPWVAASGAWTRPTDFATGNSVKARTISIIQGTTYGGSTYLLQTNGSITIDTTSQTWVSQLPSSVVSGSNAVIAFGASSGDATGATDVATIQGAINQASTLAAASGGKAIARGQAGNVYIVACNSTMTVTQASGNVSTNQPYALEIPSNVTLDMNGSTLRVAAGSLGTTVCNQSRNVSTYTDHDLGLINAVIDRQNNSDTGGAAITFSQVTRPTLRNVKVINAQYYAVSTYANTQAYYDNLIADTIVGQGLSLGQPYTGQQEDHATCGTLIGRNCANFGTGSQPGNGLYAVFSSSTIETVIQYNCAGGIKVQSTDLVIGTAFVDGGANATSNCGLKFQQGNAQGVALRCHVNALHCINQPGQGIYFEGCTDCTVDDYYGYNNCLLGTSSSEIWIGGTRDCVRRAMIDSSLGIGILVRAYSTDYRLGTITVRNPNNALGSAIPAVSVAGGDGQIDSLTSADEMTPPVGFGVTAVASGGSFSAATYYWVVTFVNANGETIGSFEASTAIVANGEANLSWLASSDSTWTATKVYRYTASHTPGATALVATLGAVTSYTDTGTAAGLGAPPSYNTATRKGMSYGISITSSAAQIRVLSLKAYGYATGPYSITGSTVRAQNIATGPPWQGQIVLTAEPIPATGPSYGKIIPSGAYDGADVTNITTTDGIAYGNPCAQPIILASSITLAAIGADIFLPGDPGSTVQLCIWNDNGSGRPGSLFLAAGTVSGALSVALGSSLSTGSPITSLTLATGLATPIASGSSVTLNDGSGHTQTWALSAAAAVGATTLTVTSQTPNFAYPSGTTNVYYGGYEEITSGTFGSVSVPAGRYWLGCIKQFSSTSATPPKIYGTTGTCFPMPQPTVGASTINTNFGGYGGTSQGNGAPTTFSGANAQGGGIPHVVIKAT